MNLRYGIEPWSLVLPEMRPLMQLLWADVAIDQDRFVAKCDEEKYAALEKLNMLSVATLRDGEKLVGYYVALITPNPHYLGAGLMALTDMYFVLPEYRSANVGLRLFTFAENQWRALGCVKCYSSHKIHRDRSAMFKVLGWKASDIIYSKVLA